MGLLRHEEVHRLIRYLRQYINDRERLANIEEELSGEFAEEFLREPDLLVYFPELTDEFTEDDTRWKLRVIPHAHLRMVQRGIKLNDLSALFQRFIEMYGAIGQVIMVGPYSITGRPKPRAAIITLRADVDTVDDKDSQAHVVTVFMGRGSIEGLIEIDLT